MEIKTSNLNKKDVSELASFFELLAKFDFEDKKKKEQKTEKLPVKLSLKKK